MRKANLVQIQGDHASPDTPNTDAATSPVARATVLLTTPEGLVRVAFPAGIELDCEVVETLLQAALAPGDPVVVALPTMTADLGVVIGRVTRYHRPPVPVDLVVKANESLTIQCGQSSIELRADGRVLIRGEDVLVRAKGTKRIRAGTVSIN